MLNAHPVSLSKNWPGFHLVITSRLLRLEFIVGRAVSFSAATSDLRLKSRREPSVHRSPGDNKSAADSDVGYLAASKRSVNPVPRYAKNAGEFSRLVGSEFASPVVPGHSADSLRVLHAVSLYHCVFS